MDIDIYVVTVKTFNDRIAHMREQEKKYNLRFEFLWPYDAVDLTDEDRNGFYLPKDTSISSAKKHLLAQYRLLESGSDIAVVLEDDAIREGIKAYSDWPTIPQLYVKREFVGGCDIIREMYETGELTEMLQTHGIDAHPA